MGEESVPPLGGKSVPDSQASAFAQAAEQMRMRLAESAQAQGPPCAHPGTPDTASELYRGPYQRWLQDHNRAAQSRNQRIALKPRAALAADATEHGETTAADETLFPYCTTNDPIDTALYVKSYCDLYNLDGAGTLNALRRLTTSLGEALIYEAVGIPITESDREHIRQMSVNAAMMRLGIALSEMQQGNNQFAADMLARTFNASVSDNLETARRHRLNPENLKQLSDLLFQEQRCAQILQAQGAR
ncbi:MAG TPA: hypothetical protein V6D22_03065 [Candidatus Obscuribacterales bacterium]